MGNMKRLILIFLLVLLPLQGAWAVAASYCQHEQDSSARHFGHHIHKHNGSAETPAKVKLGMLGDADCGGCHFNCSSILPCEQLSLPIVRIPVPADTYHVQYHSFIPEALNKPNWRPVV